MKHIFVALMAAFLLSFASPSTASTCNLVACVTMHDTIPNFAGAPTISSVQSGNWSDAATWNQNRVPTSADIVSVVGGTTVTITDVTAQAAVVGIQTSGSLVFAPTVDTKLRVGTVLVMPSGTLQMGTALAPVTARAEILIADTPLDLVNDPFQFGTGVVSVDGKVIINGAPKTEYVRLAAEPTVGTAVLSFATPVVGWSVGDKIFLPDSKIVTQSTSTYTYQGEDAVVASVAPDGLSITLAAPTAFQHPGSRDGNDVIEFYPHIGNLSRRVVIQSENPTGTRGHVLATERADVEIRNALFLNLGRTTYFTLDNTTKNGAGVITHVGTNQIGRYAIHMHHVYGSTIQTAKPQFIVQGNAVSDEASLNTHKWGIAVHGSHYGLIDKNVVYNAAGFGIGTEDGSESYNVFSSNLVARVRGLALKDQPEGAQAFWFRGPNNYVRDNIAVNAWNSGAGVAHGYLIQMVYLGNICVPRFQGADMTQCVTVNGNSMPLREFARNEAYGAIDTGLSIWWLGTQGGYTDYATGISTIKDFRVWNYMRYGAFMYPVNKLTIDGMVARYRRQALGNINDDAMGIFFSDYSSTDVVMKNLDLQNARNGVVAPFWARGTTVIENSYLRNAQNIVVNTIGAPGADPRSWLMPAKTLIVRNVEFAAVNGSIGNGAVPTDIKMAYSTQFGAANLIKKDLVFVFDYNKVAGDNFQVFYNQQVGTFVVPQTSGNLTGAPVAGLTNNQTWATYGIAIAGEVVNDGVTKPKITGGMVRYGTFTPPNTAPVIDDNTTQAQIPQASFDITGLSHTYDGQVKAATVATNPNGLPGLTVSYSPSVPVNVGAYSVTASLNNTGYLSSPVTATLFIAPASLTVAAPSAVIPFGGAIPTLTPTVTGFVGGETDSVLLTSPTCTTTATSMSPAGIYPVVCAGGTATNYTFSYTAGLIEIAPAPVVIINQPPPTEILLTNASSSVTIPTGSGVTFKVVATGATQYQWQLNNVNIAGATGSTYTTPNMSAGTNGNMYRCVVTNASGVTTTGAATVVVVP